MTYKIRVATEEIYYVEANNEDEAFAEASSRMMEEHNVCECYQIGEAREVVDTEEKGA